VKLSGGPFGDVAGNMIKLLNAKLPDGTYQLPKLTIVAVTDGPAAVFDPDGINREELSRLVHTANLDSFDSSLLKGEGAFMLFNRGDEDGNYPMDIVINGKLEHRQVVRDEFMRLFQNNICHEADVFIPCGGRPQTINAANVDDYCPDGKPSSRAIVEGANSFLTPEARVILQKRGVIIVKDASANKCGVITSAYEILSGILLDKQEFVDVHAELVSEIMDRLAFCARREAEWLFTEFNRRQTALMTDLSDELANAINRYKHDFGVLLTEHPEYATDAIIFRHLPPLFQKRFPERLARIPLASRRAITAVEAALELVFRKRLTLEEELREVTQM
jgi:glutamate dehydrogenase